ncbi:MAG: polyprenyl synthetase family protein [Candidatus Diapherotrites archaeon]|nr:polyprenyl synthetase family protein [Candidatus Diapherotrites archaeon]
MVDIQKYLAENSGIVDKEIDKLIPHKISEEWLNEVLGKADYKYDVESIQRALIDPLWDLIDRGGKRWRPVLMLLCAEAVGGNPEKVKEFTVLPELIHNATLVEDDIEDCSDLRRGKPCTYKLFGLDVSVNVGSAMYILPNIMMYKNTKKLDDATKCKIYDITWEELLRVHTGQSSDIYWHRGNKLNVSEAEYLQMCVNKTGVLARYSCKLGAILGKGKQEQIDALGKFGESIGVAFQIQDDILNLVGEEFQKGKGVGEDIHEGKRTLMVIKTLEKADPKDKIRLAEIMNDHPEDQKTIDEAIAIIKKYKTIEYAREKANKIVKDAWVKVDKVLPESKAKGIMKDFADFMVDRKI